MKLDMYSDSLIWTSIIVFAVHNAEETLGIEAQTAENFRPSLTRRDRKKSFILACTLLWIAYAIVALSAIRLTSVAVLQWFGIAFAAIVANGFVHVLAWLLFGKLRPGFWSAAVLVLPLGGLLTWHAIATDALTSQQALEAFAIGAVLQIPLIGGAILISDCLFGLKERILQQ